MKGIVLPAPSNQIKVTFTSVLLFYPSIWYICDFFLFHIEIEGKGGWNIGGPKGMLAPPPSQIIGGGAVFVFYLKDACVDGCLAILRPFHSISVISGRWVGDNERLFAMELRL